MEARIENTRPTNDYDVQVVLSKLRFAFGPVDNV